MKTLGDDPVKTLTVRGVTTELGRALNDEKRRRGTSLNQTVLDLLGQSLGCWNSPIKRIAALLRGLDRRGIP